MNIFRPNELLKRYQDFDILQKREDGYNAILVDIDNTLAIPDVGDVDDNARAFIKNLKDNGFIVIILSNNTKKRVSSFADKLECKWYCMAFKPFPFVCNKAIRENNLDRNKTILMGDQILTDTLCAKFNGVYNCYVKQLVDKDSITTKINRTIERLIFKFIIHEEV